MKTIQITIQERWAASKHKVHKSKKAYNRKNKNKVIKDHERINN